MATAQHPSLKRNLYSALDTELNSTLAQKFKLPSAPTRFGRVWFDLTSSRGDLVSLVRQVGFYAFFLSALATLRQDYRTYGISAALEALNRAPKEALSRGVKHLVVNYLVPHTRYAIALMVFAGCLGTIRIGLGLLNPWYNTGSKEFLRAQQELGSKVCALEGLITSAEHAYAEDQELESLDAESTAQGPTQAPGETIFWKNLSETATWNDLIRALQTDLEIQVVSPRKPTSKRREGEEQTLPNQNPGVLAESVIEGIFDCIKDMHQYARSKCPFETCEAFKASSAADILNYIRPAEIKPSEEK